MGIFDYFTKGANFGLVARNLTYLYQRIKNNYQEHFVDEKSILRTVAYINLSVYFRNGSVNFDIINQIINDLRDNKEDYNTPGCLNDFVMRIEKLIFSIDSPKSAHVLDNNFEILAIVINNVRETVNKVNSGKLKRKAYDTVIYQIINNPENPDLHSVLGITK